MSDTLERLADIYRDYFDDSELVINRSTSASDIEEWDSLAQVSLILIIEESFDVSFTKGEIDGLENVGEMADLIDASVKKQ